MSDFIVLKNVSKKYGIEKAIDNISLSIKKGQTVVITGNSGSGKTTLINLIGGLDRADSGSIVIDGSDITSKNNNELTDFRKDEIGFVFQSFNLMPELTALENVSIVSNKDTALKALKKVGLEEFVDKYPNQMSGGQQQRVSIARAIAKKGRILICDEPTGALDYESGRVVLSCLFNLVRTENRTLILVTHTKEIAALADYVIEVKNGKVINEVANSNPALVSDVVW